MIKPMKNRFSYMDENDENMDGKIMGKEWEILYEFCINMELSMGHRSKSGDFPTMVEYWNILD